MSSCVFERLHRDTGGVSLYWSKVFFFSFVLLLRLLFEHLPVVKSISINTQFAFLKAIDSSTNIYMELSSMTQRSHS